MPVVFTGTFRFSFCGFPVRFPQRSLSEDSDKTTASQLADDQSNVKTRREREKNKNKCRPDCKKRKKI